MIRKVAAGIYSFLPLGYRIIQKFEAIVREEMNRAGAQEVFLPAVVPAELWEESGRWQLYGKELLRLRDRHNKEFCIGPTHEEVITDLVRQTVRSYRQLPLSLYQIQTKFRDEIRPRFGLMRGREFGMKDAYSFHANWESLDVTYAAMSRAYEAIFKRCGLDFRIVEADSGAIGGDSSAEFMVMAATGEDAIIHCNTCSYAANLEAAKVRPSTVDSGDKTPAYESVLTPNAGKIEDVTAFLGRPAEHFIKTLVYMANEVPVLVLVRGDHTVNEIKLRHVLDCQELSLAEDETVKSVTGAPVGFAGPVALPAVVRIVADAAVMGLADAVSGANQKDTHLTHIQPGRDFVPEIVADIRDAIVGDACYHCDSGAYQILRGIEVGHIFKLGEKYSQALNAVFLNAEGKEQTFIMGCYGVGIGRTVAAAIEQNHDADGIIWPMALAPYHVDVIVLNTKDADLVAISDRIYQTLTENRIEVIYDDRAESAGIKFKDAELIGFPIQVIIGKKVKEEGLFEIKLRATKEVRLVVEADLVSALQDLIRN